MARKTMTGKPRPQRTIIPPRLPGGQEIYLPIDPGVIKAIYLLNSKGYLTTNSCEGHVGRAFGSAPYVQFTVQESFKKLPGPQWHVRLDLEKSGKQQVTWLQHGDWIEGRTEKDYARARRELFTWAKALPTKGIANQGVKAAKVRPDQKSSLELLNSPGFRDSIDSFAIRYHDATGSGGKHFDYAFGSKTGKIVVDFVIMKKVPAELAAKKGNLPQPGKPNRQVVLMPAHEQAYLTSRVGKIHPIPVGYGAGKWWIVVKGKAYVKTYPKGFIIGLKPNGEKQFAEYKLYQHEIKGKTGWFIIRSGK
jgi:hypothetical protein